MTGRHELRSACVWQQIHRENERMACKTSLLRETERDTQTHAALEGRRIETRDSNRKSLTSLQTHSLLPS